MNTQISNVEPVLVDNPINITITRKQPESRKEKVDYQGSLR